MEKVGLTQRGDIEDGTAQEVTLETLSQVSRTARDKIKEIADKHPEGTPVEDVYDKVRAFIKKEYGADLYNWSYFESDLYWMAGDL